MEELSLNEIRNIQIDILNHFCDFCAEHHIRYFLCNGTLLGAVKYGGYIPWDDDIDVCLPRSDYHRLLALYPKADTSDFDLRAFELDPDFGFPFAKLSDTKTRLVEGRVKDIGLGVNIDIFPIDNWGNSQKEISKLYNEMQKLRRKLTWAKTVKYDSSSRIKTVAKFCIASFHKVIGAKYYCSKIITLATRENGSTSYVGNCVWGFYGVGEAFPREMFDQSTQVIFEGRAYPAPVEYDQYLRGLYGDYRKDPPKEKQVSHHVYKAWRR